MMRRDVIITCAVTGGGDTVAKNPAVPVTPDQIADSAIDAARAGAAIVHIHVRDPETGKASMDHAHYERVVGRIRDSGVDVVLNITTGAGGGYIPSEENPRYATPESNLSKPEDRVSHIGVLKPEICSLDMGTMNFGERVFMNTVSHLRYMAERIKSFGVRPELEVFEPGHIALSKRLIQDGLIEEPTLFQLCLGIPWGAPAEPGIMLAMRDMLPAGSRWSAFGIGALQFPMVAQAALLGGNVRVGLEDNLYLSRGVLASSNAALVEKTVQILEQLGAQVVTPEDARDQLGLTQGT